MGEGGGGEELCALGRIRTHNLQKEPADCKYQKQRSTLGHIYLYRTNVFLKIKVNNLMTCIFCVKKEHKLYTFILFSQSTNDYFFIYKTFNLIIVKKILTVSVQRSLFYCMYFMLKSKGSQIFL